MKHMNYRSPWQGTVNAEVGQERGGGGRMLFSEVTGGM